MSLADATPRLTDQQRAALDAYDRSVSLAAGAGCGKTFVLTERLITYLDPAILQPSAGLDELVAITFTDAAAREMRDRVRRRCYERLEHAADLGGRTVWKRLLRSIDSARISTIHSFCGTLLRSHAVEAGIDPQFEQLDQTAADLLRLQTLDDRLRQLLMDRDERLIELATRFSLSRLREILADLLGGNAAPAIAAWRGRTAEELIAIWKEQFNERVSPLLAQQLLEFPPIQELIAICQSPGSDKPKLCAHLAQLQAALRVPESGADYAVWVGQIRDLAKVQGVCTKKDWDDTSQYDRLRDACKATRDEIDKSLLRKSWSEEHLLDTAETGLKLLELVADIADHYIQAKQDRNVLEFDDLLAKAHDLLTSSAHAAIHRRLAESTKLLLVDEFQDTDPLQVAIVQAFCGERWLEQGLFVVGDFKQSIYRFRGAEPRVSNEIRQQLSPEGRLSLTTNFRSQPAILDFVNALFCETFAPDYEPLVAARPQATPTPAIEFLWAPEDDGTDDSLPENLSKAERGRYREARFLAQRLAALIDSGEPLIPEVGTLRPLRQGDIAILFRALTDVAIYEEALRRAGLDYHLIGGQAFYAQQEISDVLHLLRALVSSVDELSLAGVLRSPIFSLQDETLYWLVEGHGSLNAAIEEKELSPDISTTERAKVEHAAEVLRKLRDSKDEMLIAEVLTTAIALTGYDAILSCEFLGYRKLANLRKLVDQARTLDRTRPGDLNAFIVQLSEFVSKMPREPEAGSSAEGDVIRMMSIHQSKGLEFPFVVLADLDRRGNTGESKPVLDATLGPLIPAQDEGKQSIVGFDLRKAVERVEDQEENLRMLYVACTRAADYLLLTSKLKDVEKPSTQWLKFIASRFDLSSGQCLANLPVGYPVPEIRVTTEEPVSGRKPVGRSQRKPLDKVAAEVRDLAAVGGGAIPVSVQPYPANAQARVRFSFSRLSGELKVVNTETKDTFDERPSTSLDPLGFGTLAHDVLERIDPAEPVPSQQEVLSLCEFLAPQHMEDNIDGAARESADLLNRFLASERARQLWEAKSVRREVEFLLPWPYRSHNFEDPSPSPSPADRGGGQGFGRYLHGFIDCLYEDGAGGWHVLDYKSNQVTAEGVPQTAEKYALQMFVYGLACEQALGTPPVEMVLHFLRPGVEYSFEWSEAQRNSIAEQINDAIDSIMAAT